MPDTGGGASLGIIRNSFINSSGWWWPLHFPDKEMDAQGSEVISAKLIQEMNGGICVQIQV